MPKLGPLEKTASELIDIKLVLLSRAKRTVSPETQFVPKRNSEKSYKKAVTHKLVLLRESSDRKGHRAPEAKLGKRNSGSEIRVTIKKA